MVMDKKGGDQVLHGNQQNMLAVYSEDANNQDRRKGSKNMNVSDDQSNNGSCHPQLVKYSCIQHGLVRINFPVTVGGSLGHSPCSAWPGWDGL